MRRFVAAAVCLAGFASVPGVAGAQVVGFADCLTDSPLPGMVRFVFGYHNSTSAPVELPAGTGQNFFLPAPSDRGQLSTFLPGTFHQAFAVDSLANTKLTWSLAGQRIQVDDDLARCIPFPTWLGPWNGSTDYAPNHIVSFAGSSWIAMGANTGVPPAEGDTWELVAQKGDTGAQGLQGERGADGPQGLQGPQGVPGTPGDSHSFPASAIYTLPTNGTLIVTDPNVGAESVVQATYVGGSLLPPVVTRIVPGQLTIVGFPNKRFRYVVFK